MTYVRLTQEQITALSELVTAQSNTELNQSIKSRLDDKVDIIFALTDEDIKSVAFEHNTKHSEDEQYSEDDIDRAIKVIDNIDFDWYETVEDVLENVKNF